MERTQLFDVIGEFDGMETSFDEITAVKLQHNYNSQRIVGDLLMTAIGKK